MGIASRMKRILSPGRQRKRKLLGNGKEERHKITKPEWASERSKELYREGIEIVRDIEREAEQKFNGAKVKCCVVGSSLVGRAGAKSDIDIIMAFSGVKQEAIDEVYEFGNRKIREWREKSGNLSPNHEMVDFIDVDYLAEKTRDFGKTRKIAIGPAAENLAFSISSLFSPRAGIKFFEFRRKILRVIKKLPKRTRKSLWHAVQTSWYVTSRHGVREFLERERRDLDAGETVSEISRNRLADFETVCKIYGV